MINTKVAFVFTQVKIEPIEGFIVWIRAIKNLRQRLAARLELLQAVRY